MLAHLVRKHGLGSRVVMHEALSRAAINDLEIGPVGAICISYGEATGSPAHLRFLLRRLRQRAPGAVVLLALWTNGAMTQDWDDDLLNTTQGAAGSLREMLSRCFAAAAAAGERLEVSA
jgi:pyruvate-formate lyase-activating enzyme